MQRLKPGFWPSLVALLMFMVLMGLGSWQVVRLGEKRALLAQIDQAMTVAPQDLFAFEGAEADRGLGFLEFKPLFAQGAFLHHTSFEIKPRTHEGRNGYHLFTPLQSNEGRIIFVNRGWVPQEYTGTLYAPIGTVRVEGMARLPKRSSFTPENQSSKNDWYWPDVKAMAQASGFDAEKVLPIILASTQGAVEKYPLPAPVQADIPNNHLQYAVFWYTMAAVFLLMFVKAAPRRGSDIPN